MRLGKRTLRAAAVAGDRSEQLTLQGASFQRVAGLVWATASEEGAHVVISCSPKGTTLLYALSKDPAFDFANLFVPWLVDCSTPQHHVEYPEQADGCIELILT